MKIEQVHRLIEDVEIGEIFQYNNHVWIKTNSSHNKAGFQCVELKNGNLMYIENGAKITEVNAKLLVITPIPNS